MKLNMPANPAELARPIAKDLLFIQLDSTEMLLGGLDKAARLSSMIGPWAVWSSDWVFQRLSPDERPPEVELIQDSEEGFIGTFNGYGLIGDENQGSSRTLCLIFGGGRFMVPGEERILEDDCILYVPVLFVRSMEKLN